jgi:hypothetical protein
VEIIRSNFDTFTVERVFVSAPGGELRAVVSGVECRLGTKPTLVSAGLVFCQPIDPALAEDWPVFTDLRIGGIEERHWNFTDHPQLVSAAHEFNASRLAGAAVARPSREGREDGRSR